MKGERKNGTGDKISPRKRRPELSCPGASARLQPGARGDATFTLLVPATPVRRLLTWTEGESIAEAQRTAVEVQRLFELSGLQITDVVVGDASPVQAIADTIARGGPFDAIVISTPAPGISRWLKLDVCARARDRFRLPLIPVVATREALAAA